MKRYRRGWVLWGIGAVLCGGVAFGQASKGAKVQFGPAVEVKAEGLSFRVLRGAQATPLQACEVRAYRNTATGQVIEKYVVGDLWRRAQFRGSWRDPEGRSQTLAAATLQAPAGVTEELTADGYQRAEEGLQREPPREKADILRWAEAFAGAPAAEEAQPLRRTARLRDAYAVRFQGNAARVVCLFRLAPNILKADTNQWFAVLFELKEMKDGADVAKSIEQQFLPDLMPIPRVAAAAAASERFTNRKTAGSVEETPELKASRASVVESIRGAKGWWYVETQNYVLLSDVTGASAPMIKQWQTDLEVHRAVCLRLLPPIAPIRAVSVIRVFAEEGEFINYVGKDYQWSAGIWMPDKKELVIRPAPGGSRAQQREAVTQTMYHEALHQYLHYALDRHDPSIWFNEGCATLMEGLDISQGKAEIQEVPKYLETVQRMAAAGELPVADLLKMPPREFYNANGPEEQRRGNYATAWAVIYYLQKGVHATGANPAHQKILSRYLEAFAAKPDAEAATAAAFEGIDRAQFGRDLAAFWKSAARTASARRYKLLLDAPLAGAGTPSGVRPASGNR